MSKNKQRFYIILAILFVVMTVVAFALPMQKTATFWLSYVFAVIALAVQIYAWPKAFGGEGARSKVYGFPIARITTIYLIVQLALSLVFMLAAKWVPAWLAVILFAILLAAAVIGLISADAVRDEVERQETVRKVDTGTMKALQAKAAAIAASCADAERKKALDRLAEAFRYSDPVSSDATQRLEMKLEVLLDELQESGSPELVKKLEATLDERNRLCKMSK
ncbi:MAG: hypothetical protein IKN28_07380 [Firmicutes bacterium]|nr:hypothetical protein [Bacillota bacterium]